MKISTKGRYALRLMLDIAMHDAAGPVRIKVYAQLLILRYMGIPSRFP